MKKTVCLLLVLAMAFLLIGCNSAPKNDDVKQDDPAVTTAPKDNGPEKEDPIEKPEISRGKIDGDVYTNEYMGFTFTKPASWLYATDDEIAQLINVAVDNVLGESFKESAERIISVYDMMASDLYTRTNINVGYENLSLALATNITEAQYADVLKMQIGSLMGESYEFSELENVTLGEVELTRMICTINMYGTTLTQVYYLHKIDKYMGFVIVTIPTGYTIQEIEALFN